MLAKFALKKRMLLLPTSEESRRELGAVPGAPASAPGAPVLGNETPHPFVLCLQGTVIFG